ncbi:uncharacterized protein LOC103572941 isoform X1 [Microplitis demolitor]|uniref:uncharacterized protein LOC103572941 isoform X1 n=1 Tax=Microplitis demolitor TaxID=69319 RepID=UPI0004CD0F1B|nr:uncharacterized protein LOC103572941 isoform X1 [Microplitis demolitor]
MGCGQSKIGNIYSKNKKNKNNVTKKTNDTRSATIDQKNGSTKSNKTNNNDGEVNRNDENGDGKNGKKKSGPGGPLLQQAEVSSSQLDFFRMLDEKIENGPDYDESLDGTIKAERISDLLRRWETASITWSSVTDLTSAGETIALTSAPVLGIGSETRYAAIQSAKDREGMRNIIGGRPECAPVFNSNRLDGLEDVNCPPPNMPRHVLESISQSPTQSSKMSSGRSPLLYRSDSLPAESPKLVVAPPHDRRFNQNGEVALYREQYLQQTGIISVQPQLYQNNNILRNNQINLTPTRKRVINAAQVT